jgi:nitroreductase
LKTLRAKSESAERPIPGAPCGVDVMEAIHQRRAVRSYTGRKLERAMLLALLDAAVRAPSAMNQQPWSFAIVQDRDLLRRIGERAKQLSLAEARPGTPLWEHRSMLEDPNYDVFHGAGTLVVVCAAAGGWHTNEDCCLAAQNLMLAAHGLGLATCPIGFAREALGEPDTRRELGIQADQRVVMPIVVGFPSGHPAATPRREPRILAWRR